MKGKMTRKKMGAFLSQYRTGKKVLDIGAGGSSFDSVFPNRVAFDIDPERNPDIVGDAHALPFEDNSYEYILCTEVLEHLHDPQVAINEMHRVLQTGGTLILTTRFVFPLHDTPGDFFRYTKYGLEKLFEGWEIETIHAEAHTMETLGIIIQRLALQIDFVGGKVTKGILLLLARCVSTFDWTIKREFGKRRTNQSVEEDDILVSGYYIVCRKK